MSFAPLSQKEYLIIIIISPKYYETVTSSVGGLESDERTFNTVYIHKQVRNVYKDYITNTLTSVVYWGPEVLCTLGSDSMVC